VSSAFIYQPDVRQREEVYESLGALVVGRAQIDAGPVRPSTSPSNSRTAPESLSTERLADAVHPVRLVGFHLLLGDRILQQLRSPFVKNAKLGSSELVRKRLGYASEVAGTRSAETASSIKSTSSDAGELYRACSSTLTIGSVG
jgi:hypothetical protein